ncbi:portal protein [Rhizobium mongolense]|uniref:Portal protein n=2 Tax=Rhizobium mongolense TaxID=57676 RepID=A0ABR6IQF1_9HYPH|nr:hypothetical protein [Rhizobium mongolense]MBB4230035.1 hypothetical protein [Rhizobium mongolense]TVZ72833.1 hypothetical protein BCL32_1020 [Rhizobium mongolense USDA 1844]
MANKKKGAKPLNDEEILNRIGGPLRKAADWSKDNIAIKGELGLKFYNRELFDTDKAKEGKPDPLKGRSKHVVPMVQEQVTTFVSQFERVFDGQGKVVEFLPNGPEDAPVAKQMTDACNFFVRVQNSYVALLDSWLMNGAITGLGVAHINFYEEKGWHPPETLKGVPEEQLVEFVAQEEAGEVKILSRSEPYAAPLPPEAAQQGITAEMLAEMGAPVQMLRDIKIRNRNNAWRMRFQSVRPEDFIVSKDAQFDQQTGGIKARLQGHKCVLARAALIEMGFDEEKVALATSATDAMDGLAMERAQETDYDQGVGDIEDDVDVYEIYMRLDIDGDGWREHVHLTIAGDLLNAPVLLNVEEVSKFYPYAAFCPFPLPDTLFGHGIADRVGDDQRLVSNIYRSNIDGLNASVNPQKAVNMQAVPNLDDLLLPHPGKIIRVDGNPNEVVQFINTPYNGGPSMQFAEQIKDEVSSVTGVGGGMTTMNAADLQSTSPSAMSQHANAQMLIIEKSLRFFADTGIRYSFRVMVDQLRSNPDGAQALITRLTGSYTPISVDKWDPEMDMTTTVAFGVMNRDYMQAVLDKTIQTQTAGLTNGSPLVTIQNVYNASRQYLENAGIKNPDAFLTDPSKAPPQQDKPKEPTELEIQAQAMQAATEQKAADAKAKNDLKLLDLYLEDDRIRDKNDQDFEIERAKNAAQVDTARVEAQINAERETLTRGFQQIAAMQPKPQQQPNPQMQQAPQMPPQMPPQP